MSGGAGQNPQAERLEQSLRDGHEAADEDESQDLADFLGTPYDVDGEIEDEGETDDRDQGRFLLTVIAGQADVPAIREPGGNGVDDQIDADQEPDDRRPELSLARDQHLPEPGDDADERQDDEQCLLGQFQPLDGERQIKERHEQSQQIDGPARHRPQDAPDLALLGRFHAQAARDDGLILHSGY